MKLETPLSSILFSVLKKLAVVVETIMIKLTSLLFLFVSDSEHSANISHRHDVLG